MEAYKKLTSHGSISIPVAVRRELGLEPRDAVELDVKEGRIVVTPYVLRCNFCKSTENVEPLLGKGICLDCAAKLWEKLGGGDNRSN